MYRKELDADLNSRREDLLKDHKSSIDIMRRDYEMDAKRIQEKFQASLEDSDGNATTLPSVRGICNEFQALTAETIWHGLAET